MMATGSPSSGATVAATETTVSIPPRSGTRISATSISGLGWVATSSAGKF